MQSFGNDTSYAFLICTNASSMVAVVRSKNGYFDLTMAPTRPSTATTFTF